MPPFQSASVASILFDRSVATSNTTDNALEVICAWPLSGQYGPGSRVLYYVLVAACIFAQKVSWLRDACVAAALLFPAVAALHGIVLAAVHVNDAFDMDVFGAFQLCAIGILTAPVTVRLSRTYFQVTGRNIIFLWTGLILAGLLSLTVEFFRSDASHCRHDDSGNPVSSDPGKFQYNTQCGLRCTVELGPHSPMRGGSANNIYVIPAPDRLTFGTATLLAAACCIPPILSIISTWKEILEINWERHFGEKTKNKHSDEPITGTNGATIEKMRLVTKRISVFLWAVQIPLIGAAVLAILVTGERNFFSPQVSYQTEPIASIGQWAPIAGATLAVLGSLYVLLDAKLEGGKGEENLRRRCTCSTQGSSGLGLFRGPLCGLSNTNVAENDMSMRENVPERAANTMPETVRSASEPTLDSELQPSQSQGVDAGSRRKVANLLATVVRYMGTPAHERFDDSTFKNGVAADYPWAPGEPERNSNYHLITRHCSHGRDGDGAASPMLAGHSPRLGSLTGSVASGICLEGTSTTAQGPSRQSAQSAQSAQSPDLLSALPSIPTSTNSKPQPGTLQTGRSLSDPPYHSSSTSASAGSPEGSSWQRRETLQVPPMVYHSPIREYHPVSFSGSRNDGQTSPTIIVSPSFDTSCSPLEEPQAPP